MSEHRVLHKADLASAENPEGVRILQPVVDNVLQDRGKPPAAPGRIGKLVDNEDETFVLRALRQKIECVAPARKAPERVMRLTGKTSQNLLGAP